MAHYIEFKTANGDSVLVEADITEVTPPPGVVKAGLGDKVKETIAAAQDTLEDAMGRAIGHNVQSIIEAVQSLPKSPTEIEITFGLKATGEIGNVAVGKAGGEVNYTVKLAWKPETPHAQPGAPPSVPSAAQTTGQTTS
jgi:hypothetical protein